MFASRLGTRCFALLVLLRSAMLPAATPLPPEFPQQLQTGTLLFSQGDCLAIKVFTCSSFTHVATVVVCDGQILVYDSMNGVGVRKLPLQEYVDAQAPDRIHLFQPCRELTETEVLAYRSFLDSKLGTPYAVKHHLTGKRSQGLHCAEYVTDALQEIDWLRAENPPKVSPASLAQGITEAGVYLVGPTWELTRPEEPVPVAESYCERLWIDTKLCTYRCCDKLSRWFLCR